MSLNDKPEKHCVNILEPSDLTNIFLCSPKDLENPEFKFDYASTTGTNVSNHDCIYFTEGYGIDPDVWMDNILCLPENTVYEMQLITDSNDFGIFDKDLNCLNFADKMGEVCM